MHLFLVRVCVYGREEKERAQLACYPLDTRQCVSCSISSLRMVTTYLLHLLAPPYGNSGIVI